MTWEGETTVIEAHDQFVEGGDENEGWGGLGSIKVDAGADEAGEFVTVVIRCGDDWMSATVNLATWALLSSGVPW